MLLKHIKNARLCFGLALISPAVSADLDFLNIQLLENNDHIVVAAEYSYFDMSLDFLDFSSKVNSSSRPEQSSSTQVSLLVPVNDTLRVGYEYTESSAQVSRTAEPFSLDTKGNEHQVSASYQLGYFGHFLEYSTVLNLSASTVKQEKLEIDCYAHAGLVLGGSCESADVRLLDGAAYINQGETNYYPAMTVDGRAQVYRIGLEVRGHFLNDLPFYQKIDIQSSRIDLNYSSELLDINDPFLLNASYRGIALGDTISSLSSQLPQQTPWTERALIFEFGTKVDVTDTLSASLALKHYRIDRVSYEYGADEINYNHNTGLDLALWFKPNTDFMLYIKGQISQHNLLGIDPLAYNRKTSKFFAQPYGKISAGISYSF
jgi:hypothetical protein